MHSFDIARAFTRHAELDTVGARKKLGYDVSRFRKKANMIMIFKL